MATTGKGLPNMGIVCRVKEKLQIERLPKAAWIMITIPMCSWALILVLAIFTGLLYWYGWKAALTALTLLTALVTTVSGSGAYFWLKRDKVIEIPKRRFYLSEKRGIGILITCDYNGTPKISPLKATNEDAKEMRLTFERFNYDIHQLQNKDVSKDTIKTLIDEISQYLAEYDGDMSDKIIVFAFSGHGTELDQIVTNDTDLVSVGEEIIQPLVTKSSPKIPKLFFIDACRGNQELKSKDGNNQSKSIHEVAKGFKNHEGNFRIEYATIPHHVSYAGKDESKWMPVLARTLREENDSFQNVVASANKKVHERVTKQQCESVDRLNTGPLYLNSRE